MDENGVLNKKLSADQIKFTAKEEDIKDCVFIKNIKTKKKIEIWDIPNSCDLLIEDIRKETIIYGGDTLFIHPADFDCSLTYLKGFAYKCAR